MTGEPSVQLPWLAPDPAALAALARPTDSAVVLGDPAALILLYRFPEDPSALIRFALEQLRRAPTGVIPRDAMPLVEYCRLLGDEAERLAQASDTVDAVAARVAATVAPLGRLALAASRGTGEPTAVARRLLRRWNVPSWLANVVGNLDLSPELAASLGADPCLFRVVRSALDTVPEPLATVGRPVDSPYDSPLLISLLELALERSSGLTIEALESENDALRKAIAERQAGEEERLRVRKVEALAEFAAGAGHEINNPLAVMSGQAQYLLVRETDPDRQKALQAVVQQAQRIHSILTELMQFARPSTPRLQPTDLGDLVRETAEGLRDFAGQRPVRIDIIPPAESCWADVDSKHVRTAVGALIRNGIEAAPLDGWVRVAIESLPTELRILVDDNGSGPTPEQCDHMFDPFYSGRPAGRGRGLGLPTAWRLAREQGGDVRFEPLPHGPTRFVLTLPRSGAMRLSA
ncbi:MAG: HAMP domain-containing sensor histidine kinase [Gemmataceae bacterium]